MHRSERYDESEDKPTEAATIRLYHYNTLAYIIRVVDVVDYR